MTDPSPSAPAPSSEWPPEKRLVYGTLTGMVSGVVLSVAKHYLGDALPTEVIAGVPVLVAAFLAWFIPMTQREVASRLNNNIVKLANADQSNPTTAKVVSRAESVQVAAADVASGAVPAAVLSPKQ